jgi:LacI family transcriptional regulator
VHKATASRALNPALRGRISERTAKRVRDAAESLGYRPDALGRSLRTRRTRTIGVLVPDLVNPIFPKVVRGVEDQLRLNGHEAIIASTDNDRKRESGLLDLLKDRSCDGFIVATAFKRDATVAALAAEATPVVLVNRLTDGVKVPAVASDDASGVAAAVEHLAEHGHESIAYLAGPPSLSITGTRVAAFTLALRRLGMAKPKSRVVHGSGYTIEGGREAAVAMFERLGSEVTAVMAGNDMMAIGFLSELASRGLSCPEDLSLVGFNDMPMVAYLQPALTTIAMPQYELGVEAARLLLQRMAEPEAPVETRVLATRLVERASVARLGG